MGQVKRAIVNLREKFTHKVDEGFQQLHSNLAAISNDNKTDLANTFINIGRQLLVEAMGGSGSSHQGASQPFFTVTHEVTQQVVNNTTTTDSPANDDPPNIDPADLHADYRMRPRHDSLIGVMSEWYGIGEFQDKYGGVDGRIKRYKSTSRWRKKCGIHAMHFSRTQRTVKTINDYAKKESMTMEQACAALQPQFESCEKSVANFVKLAQTLGLLPTRASRGRNAGKIGHEEA